MEQLNQSSRLPFFYFLSTLQSSSALHHKLLKVIFVLGPLYILEATDEYSDLPGTVEVKFISPFSTIYSPEELVYSEW